MRTRTCSILMALFAGSASGANAPSDQDQIITLAVDFCGGIAGEAPGAVDVASTRSVGLNVSAARPLGEWATDEKARSGIRAGLASELDDGVRFAAFSATPTIDSRPGAMFRVDGGACSASGTTTEDAFAAIASRLDADERWNPAERTDKPRTATWKRVTATGGEVVFMLFNEGTLTFNRVVAKSPPTTSTSVRPMVQSVAKVCVDGVLNGTDMNVNDFTQFYAHRRADVEGHVAGMRSFSAFPRAMLNASSFRKEFFCELALGTGDAAADELRAVMVEVIGGFEGASKKSDNEWRIKQPGKKHAVQVTTEVDPRGLVLLQIKTLGGHS